MILKKKIYLFKFFSVLFYFYITALKHHFAVTLKIENYIKESCLLHINPMGRFSWRKDKYSCSINVERKKSLESKGLRENIRPTSY